MEYVFGEAPILDEGRSVIVTHPDKSIKGIVVGRATTDTTIVPMYIIQCTDGSYPNIDYPYSCFVAVLGSIELDNEV